MTQETWPKDRISEYSFQLLNFSFFFLSLFFSFLFYIFVSFWLPLHGKLTNKSSEPNSVGRGSSQIVTNVYKEVVDVGFSLSFSVSLFHAGVSEALLGSHLIHVGLSMIHIMNLLLGQAMAAKYGYRMPRPLQELYCQSFSSTTTGKALFVNLIVRFVDIIWADISLWFNMFLFSIWIP